MQPSIITSQVFFGDFMQNIRSQIGEIFQQVKQLLEKPCGMALLLWRL